MGCLRLVDRWRYKWSSELRVVHGKKVVTSNDWVKRVRSSYFFGMLMPGRHDEINGNPYTYGFNGMERDEEVKGAGNSYDFGARMQDPRLGRFLSIDPLQIKYPSMSSYSAFANNPIIFIDPDGREWVNAHSAEVARIKKQLLDNPDNKKIQRLLKRAQVKEARVNQYLSDLKANDVSLYNYIDNLQVGDQSGNTVNVKVYVSSDLNNTSGNVGQTAETRYLPTGGEGNNPNVTYGDKKIVAPLSPDEREIGFDVKVYGKTNYGDERLSNEAGDIMYFMEYNQDALKEGGNQQYNTGDGGINYDKYINSGSGEYSFEVEDTYKERKKDKTGKDPNNNPYPLKKK